MSQRVTGLRKRGLLGHKAKAACSGVLDEALSDLLSEQISCPVPCRLRIVWKLV